MLDTNQVSTEKKIIFIFGHQRSGTTLLAQMFSRRSDVIFLGDYFNDLPKHFRRFNSLLPQDLAKQVATELINQLQPWPLVGIKIDNYFAENIKYVQQYFPKAYLIHLIRDPRDVFISWRKTSFGLKSPYYTGESWAQSINAIRRLGKNAMHYHELHYEQLLIDPTAALQNLCRYLDIDYDDSMLRFYESAGTVFSHQKLLAMPLVQNNYNKWLNELTAKELRLLYAKAAPTMFELGYLSQAVNYRPKTYELFFEKLLKFYSQVCNLVEPWPEWFYAMVLKYGVGLPGKYLKRYWPWLYHKLKKA